MHVGTEVLEWFRTIRVRPVGAMELLGPFRNGVTQVCAGKLWLSKLCAQHADARFWGVLSKND